MLELKSIHVCEGATDVKRVVLKRSLSWLGDFNMDKKTSS